MEYVQPPSSYGPGFAEQIVEDETLNILGRLGYATAHGPDIAPDTAGAERQSYGDVILRRRLEAAVDRLNPHIPPDSRTEAIKQLLATVTPSLVEENRRIHRLITEGVDVEFYGDDGVLKGDKVRLIAFDDITSNDWLAVTQFTVIEKRRDRRPDCQSAGNFDPVSARNNDTSFDVSSASRA